jgi:hypothetical protein
MDLPPELEEVARHYRGFAVATHGQSACYETWSSRVAEDPAVLAWVAALPRDKQQPTLLFASARWHGVPAPGPYAALRDAVLGDDSIRTTVVTRATQTNEVGRLATLVPAFAMVAEEEGRPLALLEVGTSAGLCLYPDRYDYAWPPLGRLTGSGGPTLTCPASGPLPVPVRPVEVAWRGGIDLQPVDVADETAVAWLEVCVWPEQDERRARLRQSVAVARSDPPRIVRGDLFDALPDQVEAARRLGPVVVFHSAVALYLDRARRQAFVELMLGLVRAGACRWVSNEQADVLPEVTATATQVPDDGHSFVLGLDGRAVAITHQHGAGLRWLPR